uniref:non-specific serine/threonine protein kinase n=1 Tax=Lygus hesperus TaxID=30085 RepID=A0A0A9YJQ8_LYGHE
MSVALNGTISAELEIRKTPAKHMFDLAQILEIGQGWKELMAMIPDGDNPPLLKYTVEHMRLIEEGSVKGKRTCSEILLDEWGTSGRCRPRLRDLLDVLTKAQLFRAAEYVSIILLKQSPVDRPSEGPAAKVTIPDMKDLPVKPTAPQPSSNILLEPSAPTGSCEPVQPCYQPKVSATIEYTGQCDVTRRICQELSLRKEEMQGIHAFSYQELLDATSNFADDLVLGRGGFGCVYLADFRGKGRLAVKKLLSEGAVVPNLAGDQFSNELLIVSGLSHPNILNLVGYSCDGPDLFLVYPYMVRGSLQDRLECKGGTKALTWPLRVQIAIETANGLCYLHSRIPKPLVHRDVKSANVLLGQDFNVKLADFGLMRHGSGGTLSKTIAMTSNVLGTSAYMAPEAFRGDISVKMDVFSLGVVLLELVTGLPPFDEARTGCDLASHVDEIDDINLLIDKRLTLEDAKHVEELFNLAQKCLLEKKARPVMSTVLKSLQELAVFE